MRSTIKDVAKLADVSVATVSNVLTSKKYVSPVLTKRIEDAMEILNYKPNKVARSLKNNETLTIGVMVPDITNPFFSEIVKKVESIADKENYQIILFNTNGNYIKERKIIESLNTNIVDGIINIAPRMKEKEINFSANIPMVIVDRPSFKANNNIAFVYTDNFKGSHLVADYMVKKGYKKFICIAGPVDKVPNAKQRLKGFKKGLESAKIDKKNLDVYFSNFSFDEGYELMTEILKQYDHKDVKAVFVSSDIVAWGVIEAVKTKGLKIPKDIAIVGYDNIYFSNFIYPGLTTVDNRTKKLGEISANMLITVLKNKIDFINKSIILEPSLIIRKSL